MYATLKRWVPFAASISVVVAVGLKLAGHAAESDAILQFLANAGINPAVNAADVALFASLGWGVVNKLIALAKEASAPSVTGYKR